MKTRELVCPHCDRKGGLKDFEGLGHKKYGYKELRCKYCGMVMPKEEALKKQKVYV
jgi:ribosomal protein S26